MSSHRFVIRTTIDRSIVDSFLDFVVKHYPASITIVLCSTGGDSFFAQQIVQICKDCGISLTVFAYCSVSEGALSLFQNSYVSKRLIVSGCQFANQELISNGLQIEEGDVTVVAYDRLVKCLREDND